MFIGIIPLDGTLPATALTRNTSGVPTAPAAAPTYRVYGPAGLLSGQTGSTSQLDSQTGLYRASLSLTGANGYESGQTYCVLFQATVSGNAWAELATFQVG